MAEGAKSASPMLDYLRSCSALRVLRLSCLGCEDWNLVNGKLARLFYLAILENQHRGVEELEVDRWEDIDIPKGEFTAC
jgi:hypothetical protein